MCTYFYLKIEIFCRGRGIYDANKKEFPLHKAVFEKNLPLISRLVKCQVDGVFYQEKNEFDSCGNTPLILAVKLGHIDCIKILCDLYTCPKLKSLSNFPCALDIASSLKSKELIKILLEANQKIKQHYLDLHKDAIFSSLESLPDFKMDMHFKVESNFIPFLDHLTPSDTYRIYKKGSQLRLDMTLVGFRNLKSIRGNLSVLFKGRRQPNEGELFVVNHETGGVSNVFAGVVNAKLDRDLEDIMADAQYQKMYKADKFEMEPVLSGGDGSIVSRLIEGYRAEKYKMRTQFTMTKYKISSQEVQLIQSNRSFEEYLNSANFGELFDNQGDMESEKREFSSTTPNPFTMKVGSSYQERSGQNFGISQAFSSNAKKTKKTINATLWLSKEHPLSLDSFLPLLQVLSFSSKQIAKFKDYLSKYPLPPGTFPLKAKIPIFFTMQAAFSLRNLSFDSVNLPDTLFRIDQQHSSLQQSIGSGVVPADLEEIYKMIKTGEDDEVEDEEDEDKDSMERANEMYNSMLKKMNQSEDLLQMSVGEASFNSEASESMIVDLSERQVNDEQFKLATHKFSQIQTMDQINGRHEGEEVGQQAKFQAFIQAQIARRLHEKVAIAKPLDAENIYDSIKGNEEKPKVNIILTKNMLGRLHKPPLSTAVPTLAQEGIITPAAHSHKNSVETGISNTKKNFQPRTFNYPPGGLEETTLSVNQSGANHRSTADNSIVTTNKQQPSSKESDWFKQIIDYKNALLGKKKDNASQENRLQTIESEEIVATEGCQYEAAYQRGSGNNSRAGSRIGGIPGSILNNSSMLSQGDDNSSRRSIIQNNQIFDSTSVLSLGSVRDKAFGLNDSQGERKSLTKEGIKTLANHNTLITKFHDYVVTNQKMIGSTKAANTSQNLSTNNSKNSLIKLTSQLRKNPSHSQLQVHPCQGIKNASIEKPKEPVDIKRDQFGNNNAASALLPPRISHKRQTSFGAGNNEIPYNNSAPGTTQTKRSGIPKPAINSHFEDAKSFMQAAAVAYQAQSRQDHQSFTSLGHSQSIPQKSQVFSTINNSANSSKNGSEKGHISRQDIGGSNRAVLGQSNSFSCIKQTSQGKKNNDADIFLSYQV